MFLQANFAAPDAAGIAMLMRAIDGLADETQVAQGCALLAQDLLQAVRG